MRFRNELFFVQFQKGVIFKKKIRVFFQKRLQRHQSFSPIQRDVLRILNSYLDHKSKFPNLEPDHKFDYLNENSTIKFPCTLERIEALLDPASTVPVIQTINGALFFDDRENIPCFIADMFDDFLDRLANIISNR